MKALQNVHGESDRISTREELHQVVHVLLDLSDHPAVSAKYHQAAAYDMEMDSMKLSAALWEEESFHSEQELGADLQPPAQLFPGEIEFIN